MKLRILMIATPVCMAQFDLKNCIVRLVDGAVGTGKPHRLDIKIGDGNLNYKESKPRKYTLDRGKLSDVVNGDEVPMDVNFDFIWVHLKGNTTTEITIEDFLKQRGGAVAFISTDADLCRPFSVDVIIYFDPACQTDTLETINLPDFRYETIDHDAKSAMCKCAGKCNATQAVQTRSAQT